MTEPNDPKKPIKMPPLLSGEEYRRLTGESQDAVVISFAPKGRRVAKTQQHDPTRLAKEQYAGKKEWMDMPEDDDFFMADIYPGMYAQTAESREQLLAYAIFNGLAWALRRFLERRGWIDDDWERRLDGLEEERL